MTDAPPRPTIVYSLKTARHIPRELWERHQWVCWSLLWSKGRWAKIPFQPLHLRMAAETDDPETWGEFSPAVTASYNRRGIDGVGFVFSPDDPFAGIDFDRCLDDDGRMLDWARPYITPFLPTYAEFSPSGRGVKLWVRGSIPGGGTRRAGFGPDGSGAIEIYDRARFFTVTGWPFPADTPIGSATPEDRPEDLARLYAEITSGGSAPRTPGSAQVGCGWRPEADREAYDPEPLSDDDNALLEKAYSSKFGDVLRALLGGDISRHDNDHSKADYAAASKLGWWTRGDHDRVERIISNSDLGRRDKWRDRPNYRDATIAKAIGDLKTFYTPPRKKKPNRKPSANGSANGRHGGDREVSSTGGEAGVTGTINGGTDWTAMAEEGAERLARARIEAQEFANFHEEEYEGPDGKPVTIKIPATLLDLDGQLRRILGPWPKRVGNRLFVHGCDYKPRYLDSATQLFAMISESAVVNWTKGDRFLTQEWFYEHQRAMAAEAFDAIETLPHWPPLPRIYYMHPPLPEPSGNLDEFLDFFCPDSDVDAELVRAMVLTPFWGGSPGSRTGFLISGPDDDPERGRGVGKTTLADRLADLTNGSIDVDPNDELDVVKTRMLSDGARQVRLVRLDNLKTHKYSNAGMEGLITSTEVSGKQLYAGEGRRSNLFTCVFTMNGGSMSTDMAQRLVHIKLRRPTFRAGWDHEVKEFVREHKWAIIADIGAILEAEVDPISPLTRWGGWEQGVLARVDHLAACQAAILNRQSAIDNDHEEQGIVADHFRSKLRLHGHDPDDCSVFIPSATAAEWVAEATREPRATNKATSYLLGLAIPEIRKSKDDGTRGFAWRGTRTKGTETLRSLYRGASTGPVGPVPGPVNGADRPWENALF